LYQYYKALAAELPEAETVAPVRLSAKSSFQG
jgi:hypothetical protein